MHFYCCYYTYIALNAYICTNRSTAPSGTAVAMVTNASDAPPTISSSEVPLLSPFVSLMGLIQLSVEDTTAVPHRSPAELQ